MGLSWFPPFLPKGSPSFQRWRKGVRAKALFMGSGSPACSPSCQWALPFVQPPPPLKLLGIAGWAAAAASCLQCLAQGQGR